MTDKLIQSKSIVMNDTKFETVDTRKVILNDMLDLIEILFKEVVNPSKRYWEDQVEFEADISNKIDVLREMVGIYG